METIIITGAANGIGNHMAKLMLELNYQVTACDIDEASLKSKFSDYPQDRLLIQKLDITSPNQWQAVIKKTISTFGKIDYLFNIAGILVPGFGHEMNLDDFDKQIDINAKGNIYGARLCATEMIKRGKGHIINVASLAGVAPVSGLTGYSAAKFALRGYSLALATDLKPLGIYVTVICPDLVQTAMFDLQLYYPKESALAFSGKKPLQVEDVGKAFLKAMKEKPVELAVPSYRGLLSKTASAFPDLSFSIINFLRKKGEKELLNARKDYEAKNGSSKKALSVVKEIQSTRYANSGTASKTLPASKKASVKKKSPKRE